MGVASTTNVAEEETRITGLVNNIREKPVRHLFYIFIIAGIVYFFASIFCWGCLTTELAKHKKDYVTIENINFDIPWAYIPHRLDVVGVPYAFMYPFWDGLVGYSDPKNRKINNPLNLSVTLPEFEESRTKEYDECCGPRSAEYSLSMDIFIQEKDLSIYSMNEESRFKKLPESPELPGMVKYRGENNFYDIYLGESEPGKLMKVQCFGHISPTPSKLKTCIVSMVYRDKLNLSIFIDRLYLPYWREIFQRTETLLDSFVQPSNISVNKV